MQLTDKELYEMYDDYLDECYPNVEIGGLAYLPSYALKRVDHVAYNVGFSDWLDSEVSNERFDEIDGEYYLCGR